MRYKFLALSFLLFSSTLLYSQDSGMNFFEGSFEEALEEAKIQDKLIFVDAFTTWCGPCKRMKKNVFPDKNVGEYYNEFFINMAIDMETQAGKEFNMKFPVSGYPTLLYINPNGDLVMKSVGAKNVERFIDLGKKAVIADDRTDIYAKMYEDGRRDFEFMLRYIKALNKVKKPSSKIAYDYLKGDYGLTSDQKALFIYDAATACDTKLFEMMTGKKNKKLIIKTYGDEKYERKVYDLCWATVEKGLEFNVPELVSEAKKKYKSEVKEKYQIFALDADLAEAKKRADAESYLHAAKKRMDHFEDNDAKNNFLLDMIDRFQGNQDMLKYAIRTSGNILKNNDAIETNFAYAKLLVANEQFEQSIEYLNRALELANDQKKYIRARDINLLRKQTRSRLK